MIIWHLIVHKAVIQMKQNKLALISKKYYKHKSSKMLNLQKEL